MSLEGRSIGPVGFVSVLREPFDQRVVLQPIQRGGERIRIAVPEPEPRLAVLDRLASRETSDTTTGVPMALASLTVSPWTSYHSGGKTSARAARIIARASLGVFQPRMRASG